MLGVTGRPRPGDPLDRVPTDAPSPARRCPDSIRGLAAVWVRQDVASRCGEGATPSCRPRSSHDSVAGRGWPCCTDDNRRADGPMRREPAAGFYRLFESVTRNAPQARGNGKSPGTSRKDRPTWSRAHLANDCDGTGEHVPRRTAPWDEWERLDAPASDSGPARDGPSPVSLPPDRRRDGRPRPARLRHDPSGRRADPPALRPPARPPRASGAAAGRRQIARGSGPAISGRATR
jgi:hypothetical protein